MDLYVVSLATGATGLAAMAMMGLSHSGSSGRGGQGQIAAGGAGHAGHGAASHVHSGHTGSHASPAAHPTSHGSQAAAQSSSWLQSLLSPRVLFALMIGFGAGGLLAQPLGEPLQLGAAVLGAAAFEGLLAGPLWRFLFRFESNPATTLESSIEDDARAVTGFDASGCGLVALEVDGQIVQLLATLSADDRSRGVHVRSGDTVRVSEVDAERGRCIVRAI